MKLLQKLFLLFIYLLLIFFIFYFINQLIFKPLKNSNKENFDNNNSIKTNLITHIYNEEYLLPFWLEYHKDMFDNIIIIDYRSTDRSLEICKEICPKSKIITTINEFFDAKTIDSEVMDIENELEGIKIVLNVTEFLICKVPIQSIFTENEQQSFSISSYSPHSENEYTNIKNINELMQSLLNDDIGLQLSSFRGMRQIHNFKNGNYTLGRHSTENPTISTHDLYIIWFGYFPFNSETIKRKLQIKNNISESDKNSGLGFQHFKSEEEMISINKEFIKSSVPFKDINPQLYEIIKSKYGN